ncbi:MAG TPA: type 1 glutamine amidotransferase [Desulfomonilaceae bacterium]|nr:type 1 glutamine amidotransferase [Desulfomonilaceae bacterium]
MRMAVIMHVQSEGPGSLGTFFESLPTEIRTVRLYDGEALPDPAELDAVVSLGGPMNVYEEERYPFLRDETAFLATAIRHDIPVLGICLGAQMIAKAAGARVTKSPRKEVGWGEVSLTETGKNDLLFQGLPETLDVLQWHEDMFLIPNGASLLASSSDCPHQAFRYRNAFGLQFHLEVTGEILAEWFSDSPELGTILDRYNHLEPVLSQRAQRMYKNFLELIRNRG